MVTGSAGEPPVKHILFLAAMAGLIGWMALGGQDDGDEPPAGSGMQATARFRVSTGQSRGADAGTVEGVVVRAAAAVLAERLRGLGANRVDVAVDGNDITCQTWGLDGSMATKVFDALSGAGAGTLPTTEMMEMLCARGTVQFLIEVRTPGATAAHEDRTRPTIWTESPGSFHMYKLAEIARWQAASTASPQAPYEPQNPDFRVVPKRGRAGSQPEDFHVVEMPTNPAHIFDGTRLENPRLGSGYGGRPVLLVSVRADAQADLHAFTERNIGLPMAIVVNGELLAAPTIQAALSDAVQISTRGNSEAEALAEVRVLVAALQSGVLEVPVTFVSLTAESK